MLKIGFFGLLGLLFIGLKLGNVIDWSWLWVLSPLLIGPALILSMLLFAGVLHVVADLISAVGNVRKDR